MPLVRWVLTYTTVDICLFLVSSFAFQFTLGKEKYISLNQTIQVRQLSEIDLDI